VIRGAGPDYSPRVPDYAALLRGVNLASQRRASAAQLRSAFEQLGMRDVATFRTSGNVVFGARQPARQLTDLIEAALGKALGFEVTVFLRSEAEIRAVAARQPFEPGLVESSRGKLQITFLPRRPAAGARTRVLAKATEQDRLALSGRELYWLPSGGTRESALDRAAIERLVGPTTMRTKGTIDALVAKYFSDRTAPRGRLFHAM
jgi:uncharacterized protein (DUF1697 family)